MCIRDSLPAKLGEGWFLNHPIPRPQTGRGFVRVWSEAQRWQESADIYQVQVGEGLATSVHPEAPWTIMSAQWYFLKSRWQEADCAHPLVTQIAREARLQEQFEQAGIRSASWRLLRGVARTTGAEVLIGGTSITCPPFFRAMGRGSTALWGDLEGRAIVLWDLMTPEEQTQWQETFEKRNDWILLHRKNKAHHQKAGEPPNDPPGEVWLTLKRGGTKGEPRKGKAMRERGWWRTGSVKACDNRYTLICRVPRGGATDILDPSLIERAWFCSRGKDDLTMRNQGVEGNFWLGTEAGYLGAYGFPGAVVATDGAVQNGRMGAGFTSLSWQPIGKQWEELPEAEVAGVSPITNSLAGLEMSQGRSPSYQGAQGRASQ